MPSDSPENIQKITLPEPVRRKHNFFVFQGSSLFESYGGIEYYLDDLVSLLSDVYGLENVCTMVPRRRDHESLVSRSYKAVFVPFSRASVLQKIENRFSPRYLAMAFKNIRRINPTLLVCGHVSLGPMVHLLGKICKVPYITIGYGIECWGNLWPQDEWALRNSRGVLSISEWTKRVLVDRGYSAKGIMIFHPQLPACYEKIPAPQRPRPEKGPFTLLSVSRLDAVEKYKGQDHVLQALYRLRNSESEFSIKYIIQGEGTDRSRLEQLVRELNLDSMVEFRPAVKDRSHFEMIYREADVFVLPSRFGYWDRRWHGEGFGIVYLEAAAFGVPSIAYNCGGVTDIINSGENGILVEPDNIDELSRAISHLYKNREQVFELGKKAHTNVMNRFTREAVRNQLIRAFNRW